MLVADLDVRIIEQHSTLLRHGSLPADRQDLLLRVHLSQKI